MTLNAYNASPITINFHPADHASCAVAPATDGVSVSGSPLALTELHATDSEKTYTVVLDTDPTASVTITATVGNTSAAEIKAGIASFGNAATLNFSAGGDGSGTGTGNGNWAVPQTVTVRAKTDADTANETFNITHSAAAVSGPYNGIMIDPVSVTTTDAGHGVTVSALSKSSVHAGDETATYTVRLNSQPSGSVVISTMSNMTARATVSPATLTFTASGASAWNVPQTVTVTGKGQGTATISHAVQSSGDTTNYPTSMSIPTVTVTVTADPRQVLDLSFNDTDVHEGSNTRLRVTATGASSTIAVAGGTNLLTFSGEGVTSSDYSVVAATNFVFSPPNHRREVRFTANTDSTDEPNETVTVGLQSLPNNYRAGTTASILLIDNDPTSVTLGGGGTVAEDGSNSADVTVTLGRNLVASETVTVPLAISGSGIMGGDYTIRLKPNTSTVTYNRGVTLSTAAPHSTAHPALVFAGHATDTVQVATLEVEAVHDTTDEGASEALTVGFGTGTRAVSSNLDLASGTGTTGTTTAGTATVTITDDDGVTVPTLKVEVPTVTEGETGIVKLTLSRASSQAIDVVVAAVSVANCGVGITCPQGTTPAGDADYSLTTAAITFAIGETTKTVSFTTTDDSASESTEVFLIQVGDLSSSEATIDSSTPADAHDFGVPHWFVRIQDNDNPANPNVTIAPGASPVVEGTAATFTVTATPAPTSATDVSVTVSEDESAGQDFVASGDETTHTVSIPTSGTATLTIATVVDSTDEPDGAVTATVDTGSGYTVGNPSSATVTITDDAVMTPVLSIALPSGEGVEPNAAGQLEYEEIGGLGGTTLNFNVTLTPAPAANFTACVRITEAGGDRVASTVEVVRAVTVPDTGTTSVTFDWTDTAADDPNSVVKVEAVAPNTAPCTGAGSYTVSTSDAAKEALIVDDEATVVELTSSDMSMAEGDNTDTATLTVSLARRLQAGEVIAVPISLTTDTMARLPGSTVSMTDSTPNHDFTVTTSGTGVSDDNLLTASPKVIFTGHDTNTVQTATVTLTPVSGRDDGDGDVETISATLATDSVLGSTSGTGTTTGGGAMRHGTNYMASLTMTDDDAAPPAVVEAWAGWKRSPDWIGFRSNTFPTGGLKRPNTVASTPGMWPLQDFAPGLTDYVIRLSDRPSGQVTVTASRNNSDVQLGLTRNGPWQSSLTITFERRFANNHGSANIDACNNSHDYTKGGDAHDSSADTSWECWRKVWVRRVASNNNCTDITHTASGGGIRSRTIETIRAHAPKNLGCPLLTPKTEPPVQNAPAVEVPTEAVANLQVTAADAASASATWDKVPHATGYYVEWSGRDGGGQEAFADVRSVTGTTATVEHNAQEAWTLSVTVTPEYVDGNGDTQQLADLSAMAALPVGPAPSPLQAAADRAAACVPAGVRADVERYVKETPGGRGSARANLHQQRWREVLDAFDGKTGGMTGTEARAMMKRYTKKRWEPVVEAIECLETAAAAAAAATAEQKPPAAATPAVTIAAGGDVTEGAAAGFTLTADPAPAADLAVTVGIEQTGSVADAAALGSRQVTIPAGKTEAAFSVATAQDETDEPAGAIAATVSDGTGYTVDTEGSTATVAVEDDDATGVALSAPAGDLPEATGRKTLTLTLGRALVQGESLSVPLLFAGTATLGTDYTLTAPSPAPEGVTYANLASTDPANPPTATFTGPAAGASATAATLLLATLADSVDEGESEAVTVATGTLAATGLGGGAAGSGTASFAILEPPPEIAIAAKTDTVAEGGDAEYTLTASRAPGADLTVNVAVSEAEGSDFVAADREGSHTAVIPKGKTETVFAVPTVDDSADEPDGSVTVTLAADGADGLRYTVAAAPDDTASVEVTDNDEAAGVPSLSVADGEANENEGRLPVVIRLSPPSKGKVTVWARTRESNPVSARAGVDYRVWHARWGIRIDFRPGETERRLAVRIYNDSHDEGSETFEVVLSDPSGGAAIADGTGVMTIVNSDPMPAAWLARFGRTVAEQALDGISGRMSASRTAGAHGTIAGQALNLDPGSGSGAGGSGAANDNAALGSPSGNLSRAQSDVARAFGASGHGDFGTGFGSGSGGTQPRSQGMTGLEALLGSSFTATGEKDGTGGSMAFWGRAAQSRFDGREGTFSLDGETTTAMLGADYARGRWLVGMALMQSSGEGGYADSGTGQCPDTADMDAAMRAYLCDGAVREGDGKVEASLTAAVPYAAIQASERLKLWGALGYGTGEVTLKPEPGGVLKSDISWTMASMGLRGELLPPPKAGSGPGLALTSDALWARTSSEKTSELAASDSDVTRLRLGLEGSWKVALEDGGSLTPKLEIGARHDGGDAETGFGVEVGGGLAWVDPALGLSLDLSGRTLIAHASDDLEDRGFAASLAFDPDPATKRGPSLTLTQDWGGQAKGGLDALFTPETLDRRSGGGAATSRWQAEAAWGFPAFGGRFTGSPHAGLGLATGARDYSLGWRLTPAANANAPDVSFGVKATRRENDGVEPEHTFGFEAAVRW